MYGFIWVSGAVPHDHVEQWGGYSSADMIREGVPAFTNRNLGKLKVFMDQHRPEHLVAELPMDPSRPLAAVRDEDAWTFMKDLVQRHRGELREIIGEKQNQFLSTFMCTCRTFGTPGVIPLPGCTSQHSCWVLPHMYSYTCFVI